MIIDLYNTPLNKLTHDSYLGISQVNPLAEQNKLVEETVSHLDICQALHVLVPVASVHPWTWQSPYNGQESALIRLTLHRKY